MVARIWDPICLQRLYNVYCVSCIYCILVIRVTWLACASFLRVVVLWILNFPARFGGSLFCPLLYCLYLLSVFSKALRLFFCNFEIVLPYIFVFCHGSWVFWLSYACEVVLCYSLTHSLTAWCRVLPEQLTGLQLVKEFPAFHIYIYIYIYIISYI